MSQLYKKKIITRCVGGARVEESIIEAINLSATEDCDVEFNHNDVIYTIKQEDVKMLCIKILRSCIPKSEDVES